MNFFSQNLASLQRKLAARASLGSKGFTLIEAMILAAMMAIIVTAFSTYTFQRAKQIEMANKRKNYQQIQNQIKAAPDKPNPLSSLKSRRFVQILRSVQHLLLS